MKKSSQLKLTLAGLSLMGIAQTQALSLASSQTVTTSSTPAVEEQSTVDDQSIKFKLSSQLNDMYPGNNIEVTVFNGHALLTGQVKTSDVKKNAANFAQKFAGITKVSNYLSLGQKQSAAQTSKDSWITTKATAKLTTISGVDTTTIKLVTTNGVIYILGEVNPDQATALINNLRKINGVHKVVPIYKLKSSK